jgi:hypothetical protein
VGTTMSSSTSFPGAGSNSHIYATHQPARIDTPPIFKNAPMFAGEKDNLSHARTAVLEDLGSSISQVPYEFFEANVLPPLHTSIRVGRVVDKLKKTGIIVRGRWKYFPQDPYLYAKSSSDVHGTENEVFGRLVPLISDIIKSTESRRGRTQLVEYLSLPNNIPISSFNEKSGKPDGYFIFIDGRSSSSQGRHYWRDIATPAEFKLQDTRNDLQNVSIVIILHLFASPAVRISIRSVGACARHC